MSKPLIAVTMGDPAGVGPEIVAKSLASEEVTDVADCVIVGDRKCMENAIRIVGADLKINVIQKPAEGQYEKGILNLIDLDNVDMDAFASEKSTRDLVLHCQEHRACQCRGGGRSVHYTYQQRGP